MYLMPAGSLHILEAGWQFVRAGWHRFEPCGNEYFAGLRIRLPSPIWFNCSEKAIAIALGISNLLNWTTFVTFFRQLY